MKKTIAFIMAFVLILTLCLAMPGIAYAEEVTPQASQASEIVSGVFAAIVAEYIIPLLKTVLMTVASAILIFIGRVAGRGAAALLNTLFKREIARTAMRYVEQKYKDIHGADKLNMALEKASTLLAKYHIQVDVEEMTDLIEAAVGEFNAAYKKDTPQITE